MKHDLTLVAPKLEKLILLIGSDRDGEVLAAAAGIRRVLAAQGLDLHDLVAALEPQPPCRCSAETAWHTDPAIDPAEMLRFIWDAPHGVRLADRDLDFVDNLRSRYWRDRLLVSPKQEKWLRDIYTRCWRAYASGGAK